MVGLSRTKTATQTDQVAEAMSSTQAAPCSRQCQTSSALESFMKFDRKYGVKGSTLAAAAAKTDSETEPEISEEPKSPSRIASELEEKVRV